MKNIIVTGGAGFVGSNLCKSLLDDGNKVICVDNFFTGRKENIEPLKCENFSLITHNIQEPLKISEPIDEIYNLASPASPPHYQKDPVDTLKTNVIGMINMLDLAREKDAKILQTSTSEVYGEPLEHPQKETYRGNVNPDGIRACYDEGKRCSETLCFDYHRQYNVKIKVTRLFNTYGPNMDPLDGRVVSNFILQALKGENLQVYGDGSQTRSFCFVDDTVKALKLMMETDDTFTGPINIGNPGEFTILELANKVLSKISSKSEIEYHELPSDDPTRRRPDISLAKEKLNWQPLIKLDEGLDKTIKYYKNYI
jgi:UDP-glucuronate decarboxylase